MDNTWEHIRIAVVIIVCVFGMATCHGIDTYRMVHVEKTKTDRVEAERDKAKAQLELEKLRQRQAGQ